MMTWSMSLDARLAAAGVDPSDEPLSAWRRLRAVEGPRATVIDLYELVARERGVAAHELAMAERRALAHAAMPDVWPGYTLTSHSERPHEPVEIVEYDPDWPTQFSRWRVKLADALHDTAMRIEHVGSTSVPGLPAKPTIDIQVSVADVADEQRYVPALEKIGLQLRSRDSLHRYFRPFPDQPRNVHVHVCPAGSQWEADHLRFRDYLRSHPQARDAYAVVKRQAAAVWADDRIAYTEAKSEIIMRILAEAAARP